MANLAVARSMIESAAVREASATNRRSLAEELQALIERPSRLLEGGDLEAFIEATLQFHRCFIEISGNDVLLELYDRLADRQRLVLFSYGDRLQQRADAVLEDHERLVALLEQVDAFAAASRAHLAATYDIDLR